MLRYNLQRIFRLKGIDKPFTFLKKHGFSHAVAHKIATGKKLDLTLREIEKVCTIFNCRLDDILEWIPEKPEDEKVNKLFEHLIKDEPATSLSKKLQKLSPAKLKEVEELIKDIV